MDKKTLNELGGALQRVAELNEKAIKESGDAGEQRALESFITTTMRANAEEFLACYAVVENEYRPLIQGLSGALGTVLQVINARQRAQIPPEKVADIPKAS